MNSLRYPTAMRNNVMLANKHAYLHRADKL